MLKINDLRTFLRPFLGVRLGFFGFWVVGASLFALGLVACGEGGSREKNTPEVAGNALSCADSLTALPVEYSRLFRLGASCGETLVEISSIVGNDTLVKRFALVDSSRIGDTARISRLRAGSRWKDAVILPVPLRRVVVLSSAQIGFMERLGVEDRIVGVGEGKYIVDSALAAGVTSGRIAEVGNGPAIALEKVLSLKPDLVMTFATGGAYDDYDRLETIGIPLMLTAEWQEDSPLAKFEWIKLFAKLFGVEARADSIYRETMAGSAEAARASGRGPCPRVLAGMAYGGIWYAPGGRSYTANLIREAGGCYLWASDTSRELKFSLEEVFAIADSADVWVNPGIYSTPEEILVAEPRLSRLRPYRERRVCQNDARKSAGGGNDFYEGAVSRPVELVRNLRDCIFQGEKADSAGNSTGGAPRWYRNIYNF